MKREPDRRAVPGLAANDGAPARAWASTAPLSARGRRSREGGSRLEAEQAGRLAGDQGLRLPLWMTKPPGVRPPVRSGIGPRGLGVGSSVIRAGKVKLLG
jgi:hypothetical protein